MGIDYAFVFSGSAPGDEPVSEEELQAYYQEHVGASGPPLEALREYMADAIRLQRQAPSDRLQALHDRFVDDHGRASFLAAFARFGDFQDPAVGLQIVAELRAGGKPPEGLDQVEQMLQLARQERRRFRFVVMP